MVAVDVDPERLKKLSEHGATLALRPDDDEPTRIDVDTKAAPSELEPALSASFVDMDDAARSLDQPHVIELPRLEVERLITAKLTELDLGGPLEELLAPAPQRTVRT